MPETSQPWLYVQSTGQLFRPDGSLCGTGYAGHADGRNNPLLQEVHNVGPLPVGFYKFGEAVDGTHLGPTAIPLKPDPTNTMFDRSAFYMHGDSASHDASHGCIIMGHAIRVEVAEHAGEHLRVIARPAVPEKLA